MLSLISAVSGTHYRIQWEYSVGKFIETKNIENFDPWISKKFQKSRE